MPSVDGTCGYVLDPDDPGTWGGEDGDVCFVGREAVNEDGHWPCPHDAEEGEDLCLFHLPLEKKEGSAVIDAFLKAIKNDTGCSESGAQKQGREFLGARLSTFDLRDKNVSQASRGADIDLTHATIDGYLDWSDSGVEIADLKLRGATFGGDARFSQIEFGGRVDFEGAEFQGMANFIAASFAEDVNFGDVNFGVGAKFNLATFHRGGLFGGAVFKSLADLQKTEFKGTAAFHDTVFESTTDFGQTEFRGIVGFQRASFQAFTSFNQAKLEDASSFLETEFDGITQFGEAKFEEETIFAESGFGSRTDFTKAHFTDTAYFEAAVFDGRTIFTEARFDGDAEFEGGEFNDRAGFDRVLFSGSGDFDEVMFEKYAGFDDAVFQKDAIFNDAQFHDGVSFGGAEIGADARFNWAEFRGGATFSGVEIRGDTSFSRAKFECRATGSEQIRPANQFHRARFGGTAYITAAVFEGRTSFNETEFVGEAIFGIEDPVHPTENTVFGEETTFKGAKFNSKVQFLNMDLRSLQFEGADLSDASFSGTDVTDANFEQAILSRATLFGTDFRGARLSGAVFGDARIDNQTRFLGDPDGDDISPHTFSAIFSRPCCVYDPGYNGANDHEDIDKAKSAYQALEELGRRAARPRLQTRCFVRRQQLQKSGYRAEATSLDAALEERIIASARWGRAKTAELVLLYGESPWRIIGYSLGIILTFGLLFPLGGWLSTGSASASQPLVTYPRIAKEPILLWKSIYHSAMLFATGNGYGGVRAVGLIGEVLTSVEALLGPMLLALLVFVLGRRAAR